jgi:GDP/UDP-N,N'-diacetylbacillosamine 2-epimerase (hydrolysing)
MTKTVLYITGSRADFGRSIPTLKALKKKKIIIKLFATGQHFSVKHGYTINDVKKESFDILNQVNTFIEGDEPFHMVQILKKTIESLNNILIKHKIDLILLLGDRGEMLAGATCASHYNIPIAHIGGGQKSGSIDNLIRDAITVFSDIHLCATVENKKRIAQIRGNGNQIFVVGAPDIDMIKTMNFQNKKILLKKYNLNPLKPLFLLIQHPVTNEIKHAADHMKITLDAMRSFEVDIFCILPNADSGGIKMQEVIKTEKNPNIHIFPHIPYQDFLGLMNFADIMIGNSSAGIIESASFHLPVVNIGTRQINREQSKNVINTSYNETQIRNAIKKCLSKEFQRKLQYIENIYGEGKTCTKIAEIISNYLEGNL